MSPENSAFRKVGDSEIENIEGQKSSGLRLA